jgi:hypothetical protein
MALTTQQLATLKAFIAADQTLAAFPNNTDGAFAMLPLLLADASPSFVVWKTTVSADEIMRNGMDWERVDNLSVGKARIWDWMTRLGTFDASKVNVRAGIDATWVGTAADQAVRDQVYTHCKRFASVVEKLFATGTGTTQAPATMTHEGAITYHEIDAARHLP